MADHTYTTHKVTNRAERVVSTDDDVGILKDIPRHASGFPVNPWNRTYEQMVAIAEADKIVTTSAVATSDENTDALQEAPAEVTPPELSATAENSVLHNDLDVVAQQSSAEDTNHDAVTITAGQEGVEINTQESLYLFDVVPPVAPTPVARRAPDPMAKQIRQVNASLQGLFEANGVVLEGAPPPNARRTKGLPPEVAHMKLAELLGMPAPDVVAVPAAAETTLPVLGASTSQKSVEVIRPVVSVMDVAPAEEMNLPSI